MQVYSPPQVDRIWLWIYENKIPIYPIFYLLKGDYTCLIRQSEPGQFSPCNTPVILLYTIPCVTPWMHSNRAELKRRDQASPTWRQALGALVWEPSFLCEGDIGPIWGCIYTYMNTYIYIYMCITSMENQMQKNMEDDMETGIAFFKVLCRTLP